MTRHGPAFDVGVATDVGRVRDHNEDAALARGCLAVVADGMGGHAAGEVASRIAVDTLGELAERTDLSVADLLAQLEQANQRMIHAAEADPTVEGMATTVTGIALVVEEDRPRVAVFNLGDSRVYRCTGDRLTQVTVDHSLVQELVEAEYLTPAEARVHPWRHTVTRSLGRDPLPPVDVWRFAPTPAERWIVCSDGLTNEVRERQLRRLVAAFEDPQELADALVAAAVANGGRDNVTVVVAAVAARLGVPDGDAVHSSGGRD